MDWLHTDSPIGRGVSSVYGILTTPIYAIIRVWNRANRRGTSRQRPTRSRRRSYERVRSTQSQDHFAPTFVSPYELQSGWTGYGTGRKRQRTRSISGATQLQEQMSTPQAKRQKTHHPSSSFKSPWTQDKWAQNAATPSERDRSSKYRVSGPSRSSKPQYVQDKRTLNRGVILSPRDELRERHYKRAESGTFSQRRTRFTTDLPRLPSRPVRITLAREVEQAYIFSCIDDRSSSGSPSAHTMDTAKHEIMLVPEKSEEKGHDSKYKLETMTVPAILKAEEIPLPTPAPSTGRKSPAAEKMEHEDEDEKHSVYLKETEWKGFADGPGFEAEEDSLRTTSAARRRAHKNKTKKSLFGKRRNPVYDSPGAFPRTSSEETEDPSSDQENEVEEPSDDSDSSTEQPRTKDNLRTSRLQLSRYAATTSRPGLGRPPLVASRFVQNGARSQTNDDIQQPVESLFSGLQSLHIRPRRPISGVWAESKLLRKTRAQQAEEERKAALARGEYAISELTAEWDKKVRQAVKEGTPDGKYSPADFVRVVPEYAGRAQGSKWLNDAVINDYVALVARHGNKHDRKDQVPSFAALSSFFYTKIAKDPKGAPASWTRRAKIPGKSLLDCSMVFIPINEGMHWTLCVIEPKEHRRITMYNSMGHGSNDRHARAVFAWVKHHLGAAFVEEEWTVNSRGVSPQQNNSDDCGVFTCTTARQLMLGMLEKTPYDHTIMSVQRKRMIAELLNNGLIKADES